MRPDALNVKMDELLGSGGYGNVLKAAIAGDADAQCLLGMVWEKGMNDLPVSLDQALRWYSIAAESAYDGLRDDAIHHRDRLLGIIGVSRSDSKLSKPDSEVKEVVRDIFLTFRLQGISPKSINDTQIRLSYSEWCQNENDKWENDPYVGRTSETEVILEQVILDQLLLTMKDLGIQSEQVKGHYTRSIYETLFNKEETMANIIADVALQDNTDERTPLVLVLDCSGSMKGDRMEALNAGLVTLEAAMKNDPTTSTRGRVLVIQFGGDDEVSQGIWQDALEFVAPTLEANGRTPTGSAIMSALDAIETQKAELKAAGIAYKRPILMLMSDGDPTDKWEDAADACRAAEAANKATVFAIGIGDDANLDVLGRFSSKGAVQIKGLQFKELFVWLSASIKAVSQARKGESAQLSPITSWASIGTS